MSYAVTAAVASVGHVGRNPNVFFALLDLVVRPDILLQDAVWRRAREATLESCLASEDPRSVAVRDRHSVDVQLVTSTTESGQFTCEVACESLLVRPPSTLFSLVITSQLPRVLASFRVGRSGLGFVVAVVLCVHPSTLRAAGPFARVSEGTVTHGHHHARIHFTTPSHDHFWYVGKEEEPTHSYSHFAGVTEGLTYAKA